MRPRDLLSFRTSRTVRGSGRVLALLLLLTILALAPALDLAGEERAGLLHGPVTALDLCSVPALSAPPAMLAPLVPIAGVTETPPAGVVSLLARPLDHPPQPS